MPRASSPFRGVELPVGSTEGQSGLITVAMNPQIPGWSHCAGFRTRFFLFAFNLECLCQISHIITSSDGLNLPVTYLHVGSLSKRIYLIT